MTISNTKSTIPTNHNELNHKIRDNFITTKKFKRKKWLQVYETKSQKDISQMIMHNQQYMRISNSKTKPIHNP